MVIDCFIFFNELEMLEFRLEELNEHVDYFVLVESNLTHTGIEKELFYQNNKKLFEKFNHKIIHIVSELPKKISDDLSCEEYHQMLGCPVSPSIDKIKELRDLFKKINSNWENWMREYIQRNDIIKGIEKLSPTDDDYIFISDCDEIWDTKFFEIVQNNETVNSSRLPFEGKMTNPYKLLQKNFYYDLECVGSWPWASSVICRYSNINDYGGCNSLRNNQKLDSIGYCGWHFSFFGGVEFIKTKLKSYTHQEYNTPYFTNDDYIKEKIEKKTDLFERGINFFQRKKFDENDYCPKKINFLKNKVDI